MKPRQNRGKADKSDQVRINGRVTAPSVRLIGPDGTQEGIVDVADALKMAENAGLDLVEIAPNGQPPVCKIMDFGKYKYEIAKKEKESKKKQHTVAVKEIRMRPKIDRNDIETKVRHAKKFIEHGDRVKVSVLFRGREMIHIEKGRDILDQFFQEIEELAKIENPIHREGQTMVAVFSKK